MAEGTDVETVTIEILDADFGGDFDYYLTPGDITRTIDVTDSLPFSVVTEVGPLNMTFYWAGFSDLDACLFSVAQGGFIDISQNFDQDPTYYQKLPSYGLRQKEMLDLIGGFGIKMSN